MLRELCLAGEAWKFVSDLENLRRNRGSNTLWGFGALYILPDDFFLRRLLANFSVCHELLDLFFVINETKTFRQGKVVTSKVLLFSDKKNRSRRIAFFSIFYPWQWPRKGLNPSPSDLLASHVKSWGF